MFEYHELAGSILATEIVSWPAAGFNCAGDGRIPNFFKRGQRVAFGLATLSRGFRVLYHHMPLNTVPVLRTHITKCALVDFLAFSVNDFTNKAFGRSLGD